MPIEFRISVERDLVVTRWWGAVTMDEFRQTFRKYLSDENYVPGRTELTDFTDVTSVDTGFSEIWSLLNMVNNQVPGLRVQTRCVLIAPDEAVFGLARIYKTLADNTDGIVVEIHRDADDALRALDLEFGSVSDLFEMEDMLPHKPAERPQRAP